LLLPEIGRTAAAAVSPDGLWVATSGQPVRQDTTRDARQQTAKLWDARTGQLIRTLADHRAAITAVAFSADSKWLFTGDANGRGNLWHVESGRQLATARRHTGRITSAAFSESGEWLLTGSEDKTVFQWDLSPVHASSSTAHVELTAEDQRILRHPDAVMSLAVTADGTAALTGCRDGSARLWNLQAAEPIWQWETETGGIINAVDLASNASLGLVVDSVHQLICLIDLSTGHEVLVPGDGGESGHYLDLRRAGAIGWSASFSPDGNAVVTVGGDEARLWDMQGRERMSFGPHRTVASAEFSPDARHVVTASWDRSARVWDAEHGTAVMKLDDHTAGALQGHQDRINAVAYSPTGTQIVSASDDATLKIWDAATGQVLRTLHGHEGPVLHAAYSADGRYIVSSSRDATARIWDAQTGELLTNLQGHKLAVLHAEFSHDAKRVVTGSDDFRAIIWDRESGQPRVTLAEQTDRVTGVAFSPQGSRILTGCADHSVKLWDAVNGREILTLNGHSREVTSVSFSADGRSVLSSGRDGTAVVWPTIPPREDDHYNFDVPVLSLTR
jgi:WD40 repeat protein